MIFSPSSAQILLELSTCPMQMRGSAGKQTLSQLMTSVLKMPSCSNGSTGPQTSPISFRLCVQLNLLLNIFDLSLFLIRYPLIIDPSGQATQFIMNEYKDRKITRTSFLDDAFRKNLESALRFGNPLLVQVRATFSNCQCFPCVLAA